MKSSPAAIAQTVRRIRFGEVGFDGKDMKAVWHQGTGFELVTQVDTEGYAIELEVAMDKDIVSWKRGMPVQTGSVVSDGASESERAANPRSGLVNLDYLPRREVLQECLSIAELVPGEDRYLKHLRGMLRSTIEGIDLIDDRVTGAHILPPPNKDVEEPTFPRLWKRLLGR